MSAAPGSTLSSDAITDKAGPCGDSSQGHGGSSKFRNQRIL